jgi:arabinoxylan arabinofuranohydrolase
VNTVTLDIEGCEAVGTLNPYELQEMETMATCGGISYEDFTNVKKNTRISTLGNDASSTLQVRMSENSWTYVRNVDFGANGASKIMLRAKGQGTVEIRIGRKAVKASATFNVSSDDMTDYVVDVDPSKFTGKKNLYFVVSSGTDLYIDAWQAIDATTGIHNVERDEPVQRQLFDLSGRRVTDSRQHRGIVIEQYTDGNGVKHSRKRL